MTSMRKWCRIKAVSPQTRCDPEEVEEEKEVVVEVVVVEDS